MTFLKSVFFAGFAPSPQPFASVSQLPAALRLPQKKHAPGFLEYVTCGFYHFFNDFRLPQALCGCVAAACGASAPSEQNTPLDFWSMYLADFVIFNDFRAPKPFAAVSQLPAALRLPKKKHAPGILEHVSCGFCRFLLNVVDFCRF